MSNSGEVKRIVAMGLIGLNFRASEAVSMTALIVIAGRFGPRWFGHRSVSRRMPNMMPLRIHCGTYMPWIEVITISREGLNRGMFFVR